MGDSDTMEIRRASVGLLRHNAAMSFAVAARCGSTPGGLALAGLLRANTAAMEHAARVIEACYTEPDASRHCTDGER